MPKPSEIVQRLSESQIFHDYEAAFNHATDLPLALRSHDLWQPALHGKRNENPFCALMAKSSRSCAACLQVQQELAEGEPGETVSAICFAGLCDTLVPVSVGKAIVGYLQTGQIALHRPSKAGFSKVSRQLVAWGIDLDLRELEHAYFHSLVLSKDQYEATVRLLEIFAKHLSFLANQILVEQKNSEPPLVTKAKAFIGDHQAEPLSLNLIAQSLNVSTFYFCKMFKKATGLTFTEYLARTRIEYAKNLLLNPNARVSEVAYDCGFISLTHFNRVFKKVVGKSPTMYRRALGS